MGNKDELLRGVAILHANGIDVVQDIVLNHNDGAGSANGSGGQDPAAWEDYSTSKYKNFRYVSYTTPATDETAANYLARSGRFAKNWQNFNPNPGNNSTSGDWNAVYFRPGCELLQRLLRPKLQRHLQPRAECRLHAQ